MKNCFLVLEDGEIFGGTSFGAGAPKAPELFLEKSGTGGMGEIVFNTSMCGYHEMLTDPSYTGQMVVLTYPHAGNYGCTGDWSERGPDEAFMPEIKLSGLIVRSLHSGPVPKGRISLNAFLKENGVPGIQDVDTRALTLRLRDRGNCNGVLVSPSAGDSLSKEEIHLALSFLKNVPSMEGRNLLSAVGTRKERNIQSQGSLHFTVVDCGLKVAILRELSLRGVSSRVVPWSASAEEMLESSPDGVLFSNGPGDPSVLSSLVGSIRELLGKVPVFGICLGHQLITHALGGTTRKMKFGHHGCNHPVRDERTGRVLVTSQNHGFESDGDSLPFGTDVWFRNANDGSVEGIRHRSLPVLSCQFHPEAAPGPGDSLWIFDEFIKMSAAFAEKKELLSCLPAGI